MASRPLRRAVIGALDARARVRLGAQATPMNYVELWLSSGGTFVELAKTLAEDLARPVSRGFVSFTCHRLEPQARTRILNARLTSARQMPMPAAREPCCG
jgi:hypothetical protein